MICRIHRFRLGRHLDDGQPVPDRLAAHLAACPHCASWFRAQRSLAAQLRRPPPADPEPSPRIRREIGRALDRRPDPPAADRSIWIRGAIASAAAAVVVLFAVRGSPDAASDAAGTHSPKSVAHRPAAPDSPPPGGEILRAAMEFEQPLRHEMAMLQEDARAALVGLRTRFVPASLLPDAN